MKEADDALKRNLRRAFQHILFLTQLSHDLPRQIDEITLENDVETALHGTTVWKELAEKGKAFLTGQFTAKALLTNLTDTDYGKPLSELRDAFYQAPRLPLLPGGDHDLKNAIYAAVLAGDLRLVGADGLDKAVDSADTINLNSQGLRLAKPLPPEPCAKCGATSCLPTAPSAGSRTARGIAHAPSAGRRPAMEPARSRIPPPRCRRSSRS
jgi:hypothetical protein